MKMLTYILHVEYFKFSQEFFIHSIISSKKVTLAF